MTTLNTPRKSKEWLFFPYLAGLKNSYPEILRRYPIHANLRQSFPKFTQISGLIFCVSAPYKTPARRLFSHPSQGGYYGKMDV
jgi:hypothetical protein